MAAMINSVCNILRLFVIAVLLATAIRAQQDGEVRIVGGGTATNGGRIEVYIATNSQWTTICNDGWDIRDADVVCRQLGYPRAIAEVRDSNTFGMGNGSILLSEVNCLGNETMILNCPLTKSNTINCNHQEDVGVYCFGTIRAPVTLNDDNFVTISYSDEHLPICEDSWDEVAANVTCRQLGFVGASSHLIITPPPGTIPLAWSPDGIRCNGDETALSYCINGYLRQECPDNRYAGVVCYTERTTNPQYIKSRVVNGAADGSSGRLEVFYNNEWGNVCNSGWKYSNALVTCRQLGYSSAVMFEPSSTPSFGVDLEDKPIHFTLVDCTGLESNIGECRWSIMTDACTSSDAIGISCTQASSNPLMGFQLHLIDANGVVMLPNTTTSTIRANGRLEVFYSSHWGTVCSDGFTAHSGEVACKQLGYERYIGTSSTRVTPSAKGPIWMSNVVCSSADTSFDRCPFAGWGVNQCDHSTDVHIQCEGRLSQVGRNCGPAPQVDQSSSIQSGQQVTYSCVRGYDLIGSSIINCLPSGVWSPDPPMCNGTDCGQPPPIENGFDPEYVSTGVGATAIYSCNPGYSIKNNNNQLICNERGMWVITPPVCNDIDECVNTTTNNCTTNVELCVNVQGSYECCNASLSDCRRRAGLSDPSNDTGLSGVEQTSLIIGGILLLLIALLVAVTIIIVAYMYMYSPRELVVERASDQIGGNATTHPRYMGLSLKEQRKMKQKKKKSERPAITDRLVAAYDDVNIINEGGIDDGEGDDEMEDDTEDLPSGPGLMNPLLMRRLSQVSRGRSRKNSLVAEESSPPKTESYTPVQKENSNKPNSRPVSGGSKSVKFDVKDSDKESDSSLNPYD